MDFSRRSEDDVEIRTRQPEDVPAVTAFLERHNSLRVARLERLEQPLDHPALVAADGDVVAGVLTYIVNGPTMEILTLHAERQWAGCGTALVRAVERIAADAGCRRLFLITTNDNVDGLRFHQRRGFHLAELRPGAVDRSRVSLKPEIPVVGAYGIPLRDELILDKQVPS
jgi:N-acetylglutamate synthase-like GNAT family acetyltransferase